MKFLCERGLKVIARTHRHADRHMDKHLDRQQTDGQKTLPTRILWVVNIARIAQRSLGSGKKIWVKMCILKMEGGEVRGTRASSPPPPPPRSAPG